MRLNNMKVYSLSNKKEPENDCRNLFTLCWDLHSLLFDQAKWVVMPKGGQMVVHFISQSYEAAALYHNQTFDTAQLSHEFLFARFAWVIIEQAKSVVKPSLCKRFRLIIPTSKSPINEPQVESAQWKRKTMDAAPLDVNDFQVNEAQELKEDLRLAERVTPFFCKFVVSSMLRQLTLSSKLKSLTCEGTGTIQ
jgi:HNH endonuclease